MNKKINLENSVVLISGANRGIGKALAEEFLNKGVKKVYAGARKIESLASLTAKYGDRVEALQLDVTDQSSVQAAAAKATDVNVLINNAGVLIPGNFGDMSILETMEPNFAVNVWGVARLTQAFLPHIKNLGKGGAIATVSSVVGLGSMPIANGYSASKAAVHNMMQGLRGELQKSPILVSTIYPGPIDTEMVKDFEGVPKDTPQVLAKNVVLALENGEEDIFPDGMSEQIRQVYFSAPKEVEKQFANFL